MGNDEGGTLEALDDVCHGEGLAASGDAHEGLVAVPHAGAFNEAVDGLGLVAGGPEVGAYSEGALCGADHDGLMIPRVGAGAIPDASRTAR